MVFSLVTTVVFLASVRGAASSSYSYGYSSFSTSYYNEMGILKRYVQIIEDQLAQDPAFKGYDLILVGEKERIVTDLACDCEGHIYKKEHFVHLEQGEDEYEQLSPELQEKIDVVNEFTRSPHHPWNQNNHPNCGWLGFHTLGLLTKKGEVASALHSCNYGTDFWQEIRIYTLSDCQATINYYKEKRWAICLSGSTNIIDISDCPDLFDGMSLDDWGLELCGDSDCGCDVCGFCEDTSESDRCGSCGKGCTQAVEIEGRTIGCLKAPPPGK